MTPIKTPIRVTQHLLEKKESEPLGAKHNKTGRRSSSRTLGASPFPSEGTVSERQLCALWAQMPISASFERRRQEQNNFLLASLYGAASSPALSKAAHLKAACCMHSSPTQLVFYLHSLCPSPLFLEPDTKHQGRYLS